jgi:chorismate mutase
MEETTDKALFQDVDTWISKRPLIIAGPCSAESEEQLLTTARELAGSGRVDVFRAGVWKPRTRPNAFEGVGEQGLQWLRRVKQETGLPVATEIANPAHAEMALKYDIDILWVGARTVVNPFSVQELAEALRGTDKPVLIKNPVTPDINLWIGALERMYRSNITKIAAIHRGFYLFERSPYRNAPMWEIPIELKRKHPQMPVICDPSHISGTTGYLEEISQKALDLAMDGLMIESHCHPERALTDMQQQITPHFLDALLTNLIIRKKHGDADFENQLHRLRSEIDKLDAEFIQVLARRMQIIEEIGTYKKENDITVFQLKRWTEMLHQRLRAGKEQGMEQTFLSELLKIIHKESLRIQTDIMEQGQDKK